MSLAHFFYWAVEPFYFPVYGSTVLARKKSIFPFEVIEFITSLFAYIDSGFKL